MKKFSYKVYDFIAWKNVVFLVSIFLVFFSYIVIIIQGFNLGLDFTGGILVEITVDKEVNAKNIQDVFVQSGFAKTVVQHLGMYNDFIIRVPLIKKDDLTNSNTKIDILNILNKNIMQEFIITQINWIGPTVGVNLIKNGIIALLVATICILIYITLRFEWRLATGTIISLVHDAIVIVGILSFFSIEIDSTIIAALMSVIGYSLNDKIVIFDRIRENFCFMPDLNVIDIFNISINQVLHRTIITSATTIATLLVLLIFGGSILHGFSIILLVGVVVGTISSIYIASALAFKLGTKHVHFVKKII